jgi:DNA polymerase III delta prime subunit
MCFKKLLSIFRKKKPGEKPQQHHSISDEKDCKEDEFVIEDNETDNQNESNKNQADMNTEEKRKFPEFEYLKNLILYRLGRHLRQDRDQGEYSNRDFDPVKDFPPLDTWTLPWQKFASENDLDKRDENGKYIRQDELTVLLIGITPHIQPELLDIIDEIIHKAVKAEKISGDFADIGGVRGKNSRFFLPTGQTTLFLIADNDFSRRLQVQQLFGAEHIFWEKKIIWLEDMQNGEPAMHGRIILSPDYVDLLTYGTHKSPQFSISFPAKKIAPGKPFDTNDDDQPPPPSFNDLVIPDELREQINELKSWLDFNEELMTTYKMKGRLKKGYRTLFYGPPGTGKTFTAQILGNDLHKEVYKIDLSMVVSKYIGETEKNLELLFARAEDKGWILFFDEADALFGKRTNVRDAHDKYANQEVSYLLQRIEDYNGLVILATNMKNNIDDAFIRRFNSILKFPFPDQNQRALIWKKSLPDDAVWRKKVITGNSSAIIEEWVDIPETVKKYELTGGNIINIVHYASIKAVEALYEKEKEQQDLVSEHAERHRRHRYDTNTRPKLIIYLSDVLDGIKRELIKEGKPFSS